jgi:hypothetical protein
MFDDSDIVNLAPRHICLRCIMLKMEINDFLKTSNEFCPNSLNVLHEFVMIILWMCCSFWGHQF